MPSHVGAVAGDVTLLKKVTEGGTSELYLGADGDGTPVAVKVLRRDKLHRPRYGAQVVNECRVGKLVRHPNVVRVHGGGALATGEPYVVMEWLEGRTLAGLVTEPYPLRRTIALVSQAAEALHVVHLHGMVHRDVTLRNLMLVDGGGLGARSTLKLLDFGLVHRADGAPSKVDGTVFGTPAYMPPEQWMGEPLDARTDVYALGVVTFRLLTGRLPFDSGSVRQCFDDHRKTPPPSATDLCPSVPSSVSAVIQRAMAKRPEARFRGALELSQALARASQH